MSWVGTVVGQIGQGVSSGVAFEQAKMQGAYYRALADQNFREANMAIETADLQTTIFQNEAAARSKELKSEEKTLEGAQIAAMAAMGIYGVTADDILKDSKNKAKLDEINLRYNADIQSWSARKEGRQEAWALRNQGELNLQARRNTLKAAKINMMATTLLGANNSFNASSFGGSQYQKKQVTPQTTPRGTVTGNKGGTNTGPQNVNGQQNVPTWSPYKLY